jgi:beta-galactosidase GanA
MRSISIVFEKKRFDKNRVLNSKFVITSKALFSTSRREKSEIFDVFLDLWFRVRVQRAKRQRLDDESQIVRKIYLNSIFFSFAMIRFFSFNVRR